MGVRQKLILKNTIFGTLNQKILIGENINLIQKSSIYFQNVSIEIQNLENKFRKYHFHF